MNNTVQETFQSTQAEKSKSSWVSPKIFIKIVNTDGNSDKWHGRDNVLIIITVNHNRWFCVGIQYSHTKRLPSQCQATANLALTLLTRTIFSWALIESFRLNCNKAVNVINYELKWVDRVQWSSLLFFCPSPPPSVYLLFGFNEIKIAVKWNYGAFNACFIHIRLAVEALLTLKQRFARLHF